MKLQNKSTEKINNEENPGAASDTGLIDASESLPRMVICESCGASFAVSEPKCPYCGRLNPEGAEDAYMEHLDDIREDLDDLSHVAAQETGNEIKKQGKFLGKVLFKVCIAVGIMALLIFLLFRCTDGSDTDVRDRMFWERENFPKMNELYEAGEYDELYEFYIDAVTDGAEVWDYEHIYFIYVYGSIDYVKLFTDDMKNGYEPDSEDLEYLFTDAMALYCIPDFDSLSDEEKEILTKLAEPYMDTLDELFPMDVATREKFISQFIKNGYYLNDSDVEEYIDSITD